MFKKIILGLLFLILVVGLLGSVNAQSDWLPEAGITPDSPFYFLDKWGEGIGMAFSFSAQAKANKA